MGKRTPGAKSMHNIWLIAKREYLERIRTKAFIIATILIPTLMGGGIFGTAYIAGKSKSSSHIAVVSSQQPLASDLQNELEHGKDSQMVVDVVQPTPETRSELDAKLREKSREKGIDGYLWITPATSSDPNVRPTFDYTPRSSADIITVSTINDALRTILLREQLTNRGIAATSVNSLMQPVVVNTIEAGGQHGSSRNSFYVAYVLFFLMYMVVLLYGMNVARSIIEEKTSRIFEVLLSTIRPEEILAGKIIGVGSVGLTQVAVWMIAAFLATASPLAAHFAGASSSIFISATQAGFFIIYFVLGFLLYSSVAAALGAMTNSEQELQQLNMFLMIPLFFCMLMLPLVISNPNSALARLTSLIPFCTPLLMNFRVSLSMPQPWEIGLSIVLMIATIYAVLWLASRIYRVGILMYGKKPNLPEILRWLKYS
jgi:ABC-2 type transport system permease protein